MIKFENINIPVRCLRIETLIHFKLNSNFKFKISNCALILVLIFFAQAKPVLASMKSTNFELMMPNLNFIGGNVSSPNYKLGFTGGETGIGSYAKNGFKVLAGFWYLKTIIPFSFTVSNQVIEFGSLDTSTPKKEKTILTVSAGGAGGYQVTAEEDHELMVESIGALIPNVRGDSNDITESVAGTWTQNSTYGFGYSLYGSDVVTPFPTGMPAGENYTQFKQFPNISKGKLPQILMSSTAVGKGRSAAVVYKINISGSQEAGRYQNVIKYIATPGY